MSHESRGIYERNCNVRALDMMVRARVEVLSARYDRGESLFRPGECFPPRDMESEPVIDDFCDEDEI